MPNAFLAEPLRDCRTQPFVFLCVFVTNSQNLVTTLVNSRSSIPRCGADGTGIRATASVAEAMAEIERDRPDVLLSDIAMPGEDGYALIRKVRAVDRSIPAAALKLR